MRMLTSISAVVLTALAAPLSAQLPSASTPALGMGDNFTAAARGYNAVAWNPALLGLPGNPSSSLALAPFRLIAGLDPISLKDLKDNQGQVLSSQTKAQWLADVRSEGHEQGTGGADVTAVAAQIGRFGIQVATRARAVANLSPGAVQLLLYGNVDENGNPQTIDLAGSSLDAFATSTVAGSFALPIRLASGNAAVGVTVKYTVGHMLLHGRDNSSRLTAQPLAVTLNFPTVTTVTEDAELNNGSGIGLDFGFAFQTGTTTVSATVQNVFNSFEWKAENLFFRPGTAVFNATTKENDFLEVPYANAPAALRDAIEDMKYKPVVGTGVSLTPREKLTLAADVRTRLGDGGIEEAPKFHAGAGVEYRPVNLLPLRVGAALISDGIQFGGGAGLDLGPFNLGGSILRRNTDLGSDTVVMLTVISTGR